MHKVYRYIPTIETLVAILLLILGLSQFLHFYQSGQHLPYADAISRLNIARKVIDNITPGLAQLGSVWLPLPQILMLPFIWNDFLWHSGIAGSIMSLISFVLGGYFVFRASYIVTRDYLASFLGLCVYALNINLLYLQTTAMSESLFVCTLAATMYYFLEWMEYERKSSLLMAAIAVSAMTLTRYEGLAVLLSSIPMVFIYSYFKTKEYRVAEGNTIVYSILAGLGFTLWTVYLAMIYGNPLYWKEYYATPQATGGAEKAFTQAKPFIAAVWQYFTSCVWMIGLIPMIYAILGSLITPLHSWKNYKYYWLPLLMPTSIFLFMVMTLQRNTPIVQPLLTIENILNPRTSLDTGFNIRYGLLLLPWAAIMCSYVFAARFILLRILVIGIFGIQILSYFYPNYTIIYQIPASVHSKPYEEFVKWMKAHYDDGKILISASSHEDQMFELGFDYATYIHEGTAKYWKESIDNPSRYAKWVVTDEGHPQDRVFYTMTRKDILDRDYELVYDREQVKVYKIKDKPYFEIK